MAKLPPPNRWRGTIKDEEVLYLLLQNTGYATVSSLHPRLYGTVKELIDEGLVVYRANGRLIPTRKGKRRLPCILYALGWKDYYPECKKYLDLERMKG